MSSWLCLDDGLVVLTEVVNASVGDAHLPVRVVEERFDGLHLEVWVLVRVSVLCIWLLTLRVSEAVPLSV